MRIRSLVFLSLFLASTAGGCGGSRCPTGGADVAHPRLAASMGEPDRALLQRVVTPKHPSLSEYHGVRVSEDYAWLEDAKAPDVQTWNNAQNTRSRAFLEALPDRPAIEARLTQLMRARSSDYIDPRFEAGRLFMLKIDPAKQQPLLVVLKWAENSMSEQVVIDPNAIDPSGHTTIDFFVPSRDGKLVAISTSKGGSESGAVSIHEVDGGKLRKDLVPRVNSGTAGGSLAWNADSTGFYYTRLPHEGERLAADLDFYQQIYFHKLGGDPKADTYAIGKDFPRIAETTLLSSPDGRFTLAVVANGDGGEFALHVREPTGTWRRIADFADDIVDAQFGGDDSLYLISRAKKRGQVLRLASPSTPLAKAETVVAESDSVIQRIAVTSAHLVVVDLIGGPSRVRVFPLVGDRGAAASIPILPISKVSDVTRVGGDAVIFRNESYVQPAAWYRYDTKLGELTKTALFQTAPADLGDVEVVREECPSRDGTRVPLSVLRRRGTKYDKSNMVLLTGYGGFGISRAPSFWPMSPLWLEQGAIFAEANLRGGGEFGEGWHEAGKLTRKQNVFDDFYACAEHLLDEGATSPERLAIAGGSNGGLLMGAEIVQHPETFGAVVSFAGLYDMLKVETWPNGAFNVTEFGTVKDADQFRALYAYSPYHNVRDGTRYPAALLLAGANDPRVAPYQSRKMVARLQAASSSDSPILLRTSGDTGHGIGTPVDETIQEWTDAFAFILHELGAKFRAPARSAP